MFSLLNRFLQDLRFKINADKSNGILMAGHVAHEISKGYKIFCMLDFKLPLQSRQKLLSRAEFSSTSPRTILIYFAVDIMRPSAKPRSRRDDSITFFVAGTGCGLHSNLLMMVPSDGIFSPLWLHDRCEIPCIVRL